LQCVAVCCSVLQCVAVCCSVLQCVTVRFEVDLMCSPSFLIQSDLFLVYFYYSTFCAELCFDFEKVLRSAGKFSVLQCVAVCCSVLQCVAVRCSVSHCAEQCFDFG